MEMDIEACMRPVQCLVTGRSDFNDTIYKAFRYDKLSISNYTSNTGFSDLPHDNVLDNTC